MAKTLSIEPLVDPSAELQETRRGAYSGVGSRTMLLDFEMGDYSYVVNDSQMTYTTIGKFCSIAAMTRINPGNHPMHRATQAHFTYRASAYFAGESEDSSRPYRSRRLDRTWRGDLAGPHDRHRRGDRRRRDRDQGRGALYDRR